jgi:hypothetical protein
MFLDRFEFNDSQWRMPFTDAGSIPKHGIELAPQGSDASVLLSSKLWRIMSSV